MSKRDLKKYLSDLTQEQTAEQILELYEKFPDVKSYYDFVFRPNEDKLLRDAKLKITNEYFPVRSKRAKLRRSVAQKIIKKFLLLGVDPFITVEVMLHNIEVAQKYAAARTIRYESFYKSIHNSFEQVVHYSVGKGVHGDFLSRLKAITDEASRQRWNNMHDFTRTLEESL